MKRSDMKPIFTICFLILSSSIFAQIGDGHLIWSPADHLDVPARQSYAGFQLEQYALLVGGRTDGLHETIPFRSFPASHRADHMVLIDLTSGQQWTKDLKDLPTAVQEQLSSSNIVFAQNDRWGLLAGGYGASKLAGDHVTFARLTMIDLAGIIQAIMKDQPIQAYVQSIDDPFFEVTGAGMIQIDDRWHIVGGQSFMGRYNPVGADMGPGFVQNYSNAIRSFELFAEEGQWTVREKKSLTDSAFLHKRDHNLLPQILPNGEFGAMAFSGVFRYDQDLPWLECLEVTADSFSYPPELKQYLNQYHCASLAFYSQKEAKMQSVFFGGMSQFYCENGSLQEDLEVPFIRTVSMMEREGKDAKEYILGDLPDYLGTSAEFFPLPGLPEVADGIFSTDQLTSINDTVLLGYVIGGIGSDSANVLFTNDGTQSWAIQQAYAIYWVKGVHSAVHPLVGQDYFQPIYLMNEDQLSFSFRTLDEGPVRLIVTDSNGKPALTLYEGPLAKGEHALNYPVEDIPENASHLMLEKGHFSWKIKL